MTTISEQLDETVKAIRERVSASPKVGVILGSGLGPFADGIADLVKIPYGELPHLPTSAVVGHAGNLCFGRVGDVPVVCMQGRVHLYEGHPIASVVHAARTMARLGVSSVLVTNAAGGLDASWSPGDLMMVTDHLNLMGTNPLIGPNDAALGPRFPDMTTAYDPGLRDDLAAAATEVGVSLRKGVYAGLLGPTYETPAEIRMLRAMGAQAVGMSTVPEVIAARHMGIPCFAMSVITDMGVEGRIEKTTHEMVQRVAEKAEPKLTLIMRELVAAC